MDVNDKLQNLQLDDSAKIFERNIEGQSSSSSLGEQMEIDNVEGASGPLLETTHNGPIVILMIGLAGAGKTTLTQRLTSFIMSKNKRPYVVNLDPACNDPPFPVSIDIRDTLNYDQVKDKYNLGPNGGIVTSLNLFATKFMEVVEIIKSRKAEYDYVLIDTPGQIEVFMWSASGAIIMQSLGAHFTTVIAYVQDLKLCVNPTTFMSNMTYATSIIFKSLLPIVLTLNKADEVNPTYAMEWITDFESFQSAAQDTEGYSANLASSVGLVIDELYSVLGYVPISAYTGIGIKQFMEAVHKAADEYELVFRPNFEKSKAQAEKRQMKKKPNLPGTNPSVYSISGPTDGGLGLSLRLGDGEDDEDTSSGEEVEEIEDPEEVDFRQMLVDESKKRIDKKGINSDEGN